MSKRSFRSVAITSLVFLFVLGVIASILIPTVGSVYTGPRRTPSANKLSQIAITCSTYSTSGITPRNLQLPPGSTTHDAAFILAKYADLNDASLYFFPSDARAPSPLPKSVIVGDIPTATAPAPDFANATLSVVIAANVSTSAPSTTTPIAWDRGLQTNGKWSLTSPWQGKGGHIAFLDGHVEWFDKLDASDPFNSLLKYGTHTPTANITEALPPGAVILSAYPRPSAQ
jgi:prepilin-type processing-associated H-X9-DG protein